jgi:hypothetical protein
MFHVKQPWRKLLIRNVFHRSLRGATRRAAATTAELHDVKPSRFDRFFAKKRKKIRFFDQFLQVGFNQELKFPKIDRAASRRSLPKKSKAASSRLRRCYVPAGRQNVHFEKSRFPWRHQHPALRFGDSD